MFLSWTEHGFLLKKAYSYKKYWLFGEKIFVVEMQAGVDAYRIAIDDELAKEDYLEVKRLTAELKELQTLNFI
jgi:hypothetical protein